MLGRGIQSDEIESGKVTLQQTVRGLRLRIDEESYHIHRPYFHDLLEALKDRRASERFVRNLRDASRFTVGSVLIYHPSEVILIKGGDRILRIRVGSIAELMDVFTQYTNLHIEKLTAEAARRAEWKAAEAARRAAESGQGFTTPIFWFTDTTEVIEIKPKFASPIRKIEPRNPRQINARMNYHRESRSSTR